MEASTGNFLSSLIEDYFKSKKFLGFTHDEVLDLLYKNDLAGVAEFQIYNAIIRWAKAKSQRRVANNETSWRDLKKLIAPEGGENLMRQIRIPLLTKNQWIEIFRSKESSLLPLSIAQKTYFDEYFDASNSEREEIRNLPEMAEFFNFELRGPNPRPQIQAPSLSTPGLVATPIRESTSAMMAADFSDHSDDGDDWQPTRTNQLEGRLQGRAIQDPTCSRPPVIAVQKTIVKGKKRAAANKEKTQSARIFVPTANKRSKRSDNLPEPLPSTSIQRRVTEERENQDTSYSRARASLPVDTVSTSEPPQFVTTESTFLEYMQNLDRQVKTISVEFVVDDHLEGVGSKCIPQVFPNLKEFHLKFKFKQANPEANNLPERFKLFVRKSIDLKRYLCFNPIGKTDAFTYNTLWNSNVNFSLEFHGCVIIKMDHDRREFVLNSPKNAEAILKGLNTVPLKSLALGCCQLTNQLNFKDVEKLILYGVKGTTKFNDILLKCPSLVELSLWKNEDSLEPVNLSNIQNPEKLKWLALCKTNITALSNPKKVFSNLKTLHLNNSTHSIGLVTSFAKTFPNIKKLSIGELNNADGYGISVEFLVSVLQIRSLEWVRVGKLDWNHPTNKTAVGKKSWTEFKNLTGLRNRKFASFILTKGRGSRVWDVEILNDTENSDIDVPGGYYDTMDEQEVEFYKLDNFYNMFSDTVLAWLTFAHFSIGCGE